MGLVYSTETGRIKPEATEEQKPTGDGTAWVRFEKKGRGGKTVTLISGLLLDESELATLGKKLKKRCGTGGSVKDGVIEIQGNQVDTLKAELVKQGFKVKG